MDTGFFVCRPQYWSVLKNSPKYFVTQSEYIVSIYLLRKILLIDS
ncbi:hypothetical protein HMPREF3293_02792 [Christensenella minuta]|uniref:Uncharacterized protein n=1 Tax=Christensenella minuta TaxID=626937 RepID=A0A136Q208_9FIRM|nr:hypothetical protein HMPREF3293_02792 [Christensenella minuta]